MGKVPKTECVLFQVIKDCGVTCLADCEAVRFSLNKQEIPIDVSYHCGNQYDSGAEGYDLTANIFSGYCCLIYDMYFGFFKDILVLNF